MADEPGSVISGRTSDQIAAARDRVWRSNRPSRDVEQAARSPELEQLVAQAWDDLNGTPIRIPHAIHRRLHLAIFKRLENPFVTGLLEAYWNAYEAVELASYADLAYLREVWTYHERIVNDLRAGKFDNALIAFVEHTQLLHIPSNPANGRPSNQQTS